MRIAFLDWLRIFAFSSVLIGHKFSAELKWLLEHPQLHATPKIVLTVLHQLVIGGGAGVIVFFLISGYVITHVLFREATAEFLLKRALRIYPLYFTAVFAQLIAQGTLDAAPLPSLSDLSVQLLLLGDLFPVPYTLKGVEWTLRVELFFYLIMATTKAGFGGHFGQRPFFLALFAAVIAFSILPPVPSAPFLFKNYLLLYAPFLFIGVGFYLLEIGRIRRLCFSAFVLLALVLYWRGIGIHQPNWLHAHFAAIGVLMFGTAWYFRKHFAATTPVLLLSDLTYSVYLFHNWMFDYFFRYTGSKLLALGLLLLACFILHRSIERPANRLGKLLAARLSPAPAPVPQHA